jgi:hypothetical protein
VACTASPPNPPPPPVSVRQVLDPRFFDTAVPASLAAVYPSLVAAIGNQRIDGTRVANATTVGGTVFRWYGKSGDWGRDLYSVLLQPGLNRSMYIETWRRPPVMNTYCPPAFNLSSVNVVALRWLDLNGVTPITFRFTQDHSKWAITLNATSDADKWVCFSDINRQTSQWARGGGALCILHVPMYNAVAASITEWEACNVTSPLGIPDAPAASPPGPPLPLPLHVISPLPVAPGWRHSALTSDPQRASSAGPATGSDLAVAEAAAGSDVPPAGVAQG